MNKNAKFVSVGMIALATVAMAVPSVYAQTTSAVKSVTNRMAGIHRGPFDHAEMLEEQASILGITVDDLKARMEAGQSFKDIVEELGISEDVIKTKMEEQRAERLAEMTAKIQQDVTDGKITQEEADEKIANFQNGKGFLGGERGEGRGMRMGQKDDAKMLEEQASILGITVDDLKARMEAGKSIEDIATDLGISSDTLKTKMEEARTAREVTMKAEMTAKIQQEVTDGKITQEEADKMLERLANPDKHGFGRSMGRGESGVDRVERDGSRESGVDVSNKIGGRHSRQNGSDSALTFQR
jgi:hypothetical protein